MEISTLGLLSLGGFERIEGLGKAASGPLHEHALTNESFI